MTRPAAVAPRDQHDVGEHQVERREADQPVDDAPAGPARRPRSSSGTRAISSTWASSSTEATSPVSRPSEVKPVAQPLRSPYAAGGLPPVGDEQQGQPEGRSGGGADGSVEAGPVCRAAREAHPAVQERVAHVGRRALGGSVVQGSCRPASRHRGRCRRRQGPRRVGRRRRRPVDRRGRAGTRAAAGRRSGSRSGRIPGGRPGRRGSHRPRRGPGRSPRRPRPGRCRRRRRPAPAVPGSTWRPGRRRTPERRTPAGPERAPPARWAWSGRRRYAPRAPSGSRSRAACRPVHRRWSCPQDAPSRLSAPVVEPVTRLCVTAVRGQATSASMAATKSRLTPRQASSVMFRRQ